MRERDDPMTQTMKASEAKQQWGQLLNQVFKREKRVLVQKNGIPVAGIVSADDLDRLCRLDEEHTRRFQPLERIRAPFKGVPTEEIEAEVAKAIAEVRAEDAQEPTRRQA
jgi:prevent-host-death family protein